MEINCYQNAALDTAVYPGMLSTKGVEYTLFGMLGEAGEVANKYKKILRSGEYVYYKREILMDELGDVLWYAAALANELGYSLQEVCDFNIQKLAARKAADTLKTRKPAEDYGTIDPEIIEAGRQLTQGLVESIRPLREAAEPGVCIK